MKSLGIEYIPRWKESRNFFKKNEIKIKFKRGELPYFDHGFILFYSKGK